MQQYIALLKTKKELQQNDMRALSDLVLWKQIITECSENKHFVVFSPKNTKNNTTSITLGNQQILRVNKCKIARYLYR